MSRSTSTIVRLFLLAFALAYAGAEMTVWAQNANSSTTHDMSMQNDNSSTTNTTPTTGRRRGRRRAAAPVTPPGCGPMDNGGSATATTPVRPGRCDPDAQEQTDLSGTYTGTVDYPEGGMSGDTTLTINGNDFTMTSGSSTQEGRVVAVTTCNYTAVTMMFGKGQTSAARGPQPPALPAVSLRAKKTGKWITLTSVGGEKRAFALKATKG